VGRQAVGKADEGHHPKMQKITRTRHCPNCGALVIKKFEGFGRFSFCMKCWRCGHVFYVNALTDFWMRELKTTLSLDKSEKIC